MIFTDSKGKHLPQQAFEVLGEWFGIVLTIFFLFFFAVATG
jgi:hypothetical protein